MDSETSFVAVKNSPIGGKGLYASKDFKAGEIICLMTGTPITITELENRFKNGDQRITCDPLQISANGHLLLDEVPNYVNHSCEPNTAIAGYNSLTAIRDITSGEEIVYDYSAVEWTPREYRVYDSDSWPLRCNCGSNHCRKIIGCFPYLPLNVREEYLRRGFIQEYVLKKIIGPSAHHRCLTCERVMNINVFPEFTATEMQHAQNMLLLASDTKTDLVQSS